MIHRVELITKPHLPDPQGLKTLQQFRDLPQEPPTQAIQDIRTLSGYIFATKRPASVVEELCHAVLKDVILQESRINQFFGDELDFDWYIEIGFRPGVTDNVGRTDQETFETWLQHPLEQGSQVHSVRGYFLKGSLNRNEIETLTHQFLMNELIEKATILSKAEWPNAKEDLRSIPAVQLSNPITVETFFFQSSEELLALSRQRTLALNSQEADTILQYFSQPEVIEYRNALGMGAHPTDVELEVLAQTWSEHCKHKIFNASVQYTDTTTGQTEAIESLYQTYVKGATTYIRQMLKENDWCVSVFSDNAGIIRFNEDWNIAMKVETHNSPSALDPYGGALTGIVGVNRDIMGTGLGAEMIFNTNVFCFASPFYDKPIPPKLMLPKRIFSGVRLGVEHGGNKSGIPTVNGAIVFHDRFLGNPLVFCGTGGLIPTQIKGTPAHEKIFSPEM